MGMLVQITDTHILPKGELLYDSTDTAAHLRTTVQQIICMQPQPELVLITGDLVENPNQASYRHFIELIKPLEMPVYVIPGNHDDPRLMLEEFAGTNNFPVTDNTFQYAINTSTFRVLALNSHASGTELPELDQQRLSWLQDQLVLSDQPSLVAIHHPPMTTGIEFIDMGGSQWFQGLKSVLAEHSHVRLVICGHCHIDLCGLIGQVPVYMAAATAHQLIAARGKDIAPSSVIVPAPPILHHFIDGNFLSGSYPWPKSVDENRIDVRSGLSWHEIKKLMAGSKYEKSR